MEEIIVLVITNWEFYNKRKDMIRPTWFALDNNIIESDLGCTLTDKELRIWVYILCQASKQKSDSITLNLEKIMFFNKATKNDVYGSLKKLIYYKEIDVIRTDSVRIPNAICTEKKRVQYSTVQYNNTFPEDGPALAEPIPEEKTLHPMGQLWNLCCPAQPRVVQILGKRETLVKKIWKLRTPDQWAEIFKKFAADPFWSKKRGDRFDWIIKNENWLKIEEGQFGEEKEIKTNNKNSVFR